MRGSRHSQCLGVRLQPAGTFGMCPVLSGDTRLSDTADGERELVVPLLEATLNQIIACLYWPGIQGDKQCWCAS